MSVVTQPSVAGAVGEFSLLGLRIVIEADRADQLRGLIEVYQSVPATATTRDFAVRLIAVDAATARLETPTLTTVGRGDGPRAAGGATAFALFHSVARAAIDHLVIHAAAVGLGGGTVLLVAPSGVGKTTLAATLALRGAGFLSDEAGAIERVTGLIQPVPRAIGVRPGPLAADRRLRAALAGAVSVGERGGRSKWLVDLIATGLARRGSPAPARHVVFVRPSLASERQSGLADWRLDVDRIAPGFVARLRAIDGVVSVRSDGGPFEPRLALRALPTARLNRAVDAASAACEVTVVGLVEAEYGRPDFAAVPRLEPMATSAGLLDLVRHIENGARSSLLDGELGGRPGLLVMELAGLLGAARFWHLGSGDLATMCELIEGLP